MHRRRIRILSIRFVLIFVLAALIAAVGLQPALSQTPTLRVGIMGDSGSDEYRGTDNRGGLYANVTFNWIEQILLRRSNVIAGSWGTRPEPRRTGLEYNWARSAATAWTLVQQGQHTGLAQQVNAGQVDLVIIGVGNQDFAPYNQTDGYGPIYSGALSGAALTQKINNIISNITLAVDTVRAQRQIPVIVTLITNWSNTPLVLGNPAYSDPARRQLVTDAIAQVNNGLEAMAADRGLPVFDSNDFLTLLMGQLVNGVLHIGDEEINVASAGDEPHNGILGDGIHGGTVLQGLLANQYLAIINTIVEPDVPLLTDQEILANAGLAANPPPPTPVTPTATGVPPTATSVTPTATPLPPTATPIPPTPTPPPPGNQAPVAGDDLFTTRRGQAILISVSAVLANDSDPNGDTITVSGYTAPSHGTVAVVSAGIFRYTPNAGFWGLDSMTYTISDGRGGTDTATITFIVWR